MKKLFTITVMMMLSMGVFAQKGSITTPSCKCSDLGIALVLFYQTPGNTTSDYILEVNYTQNGKAKCEPEIKGFVKIRGIRETLTGIQEDNLAIADLTKVSSSLFSVRYRIRQNQLISPLRLGQPHTFTFSHITYGLTPCPIVGYRAILDKEAPLR